MDGRFVPNLAFGPQSVQSLRHRTKLNIEVHLMVENPAPLLPIFYSAGAQRLIVHAEACPQLHRDLCTIRQLGAQAGVALNPATPVSAVQCVLEEVEELLLMGVDPGFGGQPFIRSRLGKDSRCSTYDRSSRDATYVNVDGGVKITNAQRLASLGADRLVVGSALFEPPSIAGCASSFYRLVNHDAMRREVTV